MNTCSTGLGYRRLRAPSEDGGALVEPPLEQAGELLRENVTRRAVDDYDFQGRTLHELSEQARRELLREARAWTGAYRQDATWENDAPGVIFLAGHQPQIFHPGVWFKNFALGALAARHGGVAVNLLVDSDTVKTTALPVPGGTVADPQLEAIAMDRASPRVPYELRKIEDRRMFSVFGRRAAEQLAPLVPDPLIESYWPMVTRRMRQTGNLGACLAQARHHLEGAWGLRTLEVPQSRICANEPFCWLVAHLLARLPQLWRVYNDAVAEYRRLHRTRSATHPVPDLVADQDWLEAPFWIFSEADPRRRRLFARQSGDHVLVTDRAHWEARLPLRPERSAAGAVERLMELARQGVRIRSRALMTTLWARLALGELFVHGIGGAKYDQVTDLLLERFFGLRPPAFMVVSATLRLPIQREGRNLEPPGEIRDKLRRLTYHPERYIDATDGRRPPGEQEPGALVAEKEHWIRTPPTPENARHRCRTIRRINQALQPWVEPQRNRLLKRQAEVSRTLKAERVLFSRQHGFCLYPERTLREFLGGLLPKGA